MSDHHYIRRAILGAIAVAPFLSLRAFAAQQSVGASPLGQAGANGPQGAGGQQGQPEMPMPFHEVPKPVIEDAYSVLEFFSFGCSFCMQYNAQFAAWGKSLPKEFRFEKVPVISTREDMAMAMGYYAALEAAPGQTEPFMESLFRQRNTMGSVYDARAVGSWLAQACTEANIPRDRYKSVLGQDRILKKATKAAQRIPRYNIEVTPTVAIGGRFLVTPDHVQGNYGMLFELSNGLVSKIWKPNA